MLISGVQKLSLLDYPDHPACVVFTAGCNFRCGYCHNPEFVLPQMLREIKDSFIPEEAFFSFLEKRKKKLEGVVVTGGEPTIHPDLISFLTKVKNQKFLIKLDTNGNNPRAIKEALNKNSTDYIAMDVKTSLGGYKKLVGHRADESNLVKSIKLIKNEAPDYEFRLTLIKEIHTEPILQSMAQSLSGAKKVFLQTFRPAHTLSPLFGTFHSFAGDEIEKIKDIFSNHVQNVFIRV